MAENSTIYEDVETLKIQMAEVQAYIENLLGKAATNVSNEDLDDWIGEIHIGYGNNCTNRPTGVGNGYFINIPHSTQSASYNKQYWIERTTNHIWTRMQETEYFPIGL